MNTTVGLIFNVGLPESNKGKKSKKKTKGVSSPFANTTWVPYGGMLLTWEDSKDNYKKDIDNKIDSNNLLNKLIVGVRYKLYEHVYLNSQLRLSLFAMKNTSNSNGENLSDKTVTLIEFKLISLSVFL